MRLGYVLRKFRLHEERDLRSLAKEMGTSAATLLRIEQGHDPDVRTFKAIMDWLFVKDVTEMSGRPAERERAN